MENRIARGTVVKQILAGIICLIVGLGTIWLFTIWADTWEVYWSDGSRHDFGSDGGILGGVALISLIILVTVVQFQCALSPYQVFRLSIRTGAIVALLVVALDCLFTLLIGPTLKLVLLEIAFLLLLVMSLALVIGTIQACRLLIEGSDSVEHTWLMSQGASLRACQSGVLPYHQQVATIWYIVFFILLSLFFIAVPVIGRDHVDGTSLGIGILLAIIVVGLSATTVVRLLKILSNHDIEFIEGLVSKSRKRTGIFDEVDLFKLTCNGQEFLTNSRIWYEIIEGRSYRLWYSPINKHIVALEALQREQTKSGVRGRNGNVE